MNSEYLLMGFAGLILLCYILAMLWLTLSWYLVSRRLKPDGDAQLRLSVVIPVRNEAKHLAACLGCLAQQDYPPDRFEVIVVDDHSVDGTHNRALKERNGMTLTVLSLPPERQGKKEAIAMAAEHASGEALITIDADVSFGPSYLRCMSGYLGKDDVMMVLGPVGMQPAGGILGWFPAIDFLSLQAAGAGAALSGHAVLSNGSNLGFMREAYLRTVEDMKGDAFLSGDDMFLMMAIKKRFGRRSVVYAKDDDAIVRTGSPQDVRTFFRQRMRWLSKSRGFHDSEVLALAFVVYLFNVAIVTVWASGLADRLSLQFFNYLLALKILTDFPLLLAFSIFTGQQRLLRFYLPAQLLYPFYSVLLLPLSLLVPVKWKGRPSTAA